jgi:formylmethanofuran dehydrogenase subunit E
LSALRDSAVEDFIDKINDWDLISQIENVASFHGHMSTGAFIGIQMLNIARHILGLTNIGNRFVTNKTCNFLSDSFLKIMIINQVITNGK